MTKKKTKQTDNNHLEIVKKTDELALDDIDMSGNKPVPIEKLLKWRKQGLTYEEIGELAGTSKQASHQRLKPYKDAIENLPFFKDNRADIFAILQSLILSSLTEEDIKSMAPASRITAAAILYDKERLERGLNPGSDNKVQVSMNFTYNDNKQTIDITSDNDD